MPLFWQKYGGKILVGAIAILAIVLFIRFKAKDAAERAEQAGASFAAARMGILNLQSIPNLSDTKVAADQRKQLREEIDRAIDEVLTTSKDDAVKGEAWVARGDLYWHLALLPELRGADTQPSLKLAESDEELLKKSQQAYEAAIALGGAKPLTTVTARFGLASIAEQRKQWDEARKIYESIRDSATTPKPFQDQATLKLDDLKTLATPILIGKPATVPALPPIPGLPIEPAGPLFPTTTTAPAAPAAPASAPSTQSAATQPAAPTN